MSKATFYVSPIKSIIHRVFVLSLLQTTNRSSSKLYSFFILLTIL